MNKSIEIIPSLLSADFAELAEEIKKIERAGCERLHLDVMDGHFVPNITFGPAVIESIRKRTVLYLQAHLMIEKPGRFVEDFKRVGVDCIIVHQEVCGNFLKVLQDIRKNGMHAGVALRPKTSVDSIKDALKDLDMILIMAVEPGFGGQAYLEGSEKKIARMKALLDEMHVDIPIVVDGGVTIKTAPLIVKAGATRLVAGSSIFKGDIINNIKALRASVRIKK